MAQRRDLLTRVIVAAAKADRELDAQREAFEQLRDLVINAPTRLDAMTQQMVDLTARLQPSEQALAALHNQFADSALASVAGNVETAKQRLTFADQNITNARNLVSRPVERQTGLVDAVRAAESALGQARTLLDAVDSAATDINRAVATLPSAIADIQNGIKAAGDQLAQGNTAHADELSAARDAAVKAVADAQSTGTADPLGAFTKLTQADADLDRLLASVAEEREAAERLSRAFDQALFAAQSRVRAVSDYIDVRRGSIGPEARTRLAEAVRQLQAAQDKRETNLTEAIAHANGAAMLASQAQSMATSDVQAGTTVVRRAIRQHEQFQHGRGARRHHPRQHPQRLDARRLGRQHGRRLELDVIRWVRLVDRRRTLRHIRERACLRATAAVSTVRARSRSAVEPISVRRAPMADVNVVGHD